MYNILVQTIYQIYNILVETMNKIKCLIKNVNYVYKKDKEEDLKSFKYDDIRKKRIKKKLVCIYLGCAYTSLF